MYDTLLFVTNMMKNTQPTITHYIDDSMNDCSNSSALAMESQRSWCSHRYIVTNKFNTSDTLDHLAQQK